MIAIYLCCRPITLCGLVNGISGIDDVCRYGGEGEKSVALTEMTLCVHCSEWDKNTRITDSCMCMSLCRCVWTRARVCARVVCWCVVVCVLCACMCVCVLCVCVCV